ncbi:MCE family protein [Sphingomonas parva]|uniref:MCE family protein n=1 Tax=Sphingomonas parva TaxID=2555898 RepID=A0A4Y8ZPC3_9SPHN|nr:MlaD family protein [Sphingomonas parva]TFI57860.1 MCE family protein [Sphingomonas parva]
METRSHILLVSAVVLASLAALFAFVVWLTPDDGRKGPQYDILFAQSVAGLVEGSAVTFAGIPVGRVQTIGLEPGNPGLVRVRISITEKELPVHEGTQATLKGDLAFGSATIDLVAPDQAGRPIPLNENGVGLIPAKKPGFGELAGDPGPLLDRISRGTDMLLEMTSPEGQKAIEAKLDASAQATAAMAQQSAALDARIAGTRSAIRSTASAADAFAATARTRGAQLQTRGRDSIGQIRARSAAAREAIKGLDASLDAAHVQVGAFSETSTALGESARGLRSQVAKVQGAVKAVEDGGLGSPTLPDYKPRD